MGNDKRIQVDQLSYLESRMKGSKRYKSRRADRLYIDYGSRRGWVETTVWFEVVNDILTPFVKVANVSGVRDEKMEAFYMQSIRKQFKDIIYRSEKERKSYSLNERLLDDVTPVYDECTLPHQVEAIKFCCSMKVSALFADTGTGKCKIAIHTANSRFLSGKIEKVLVVLPVSTKANFQKETDKWSRNSPITWKLVGHESISESARIYKDAVDFVDNRTMIIIDESHFVKNYITKRSKRLNVICDRSSYKLLLTGTPITEGIQNLYQQYRLLNPLIIGMKNWKQFEDTYLIMGGEYEDRIIGFKNTDHLISLVDPYTYSIDKRCLNLPRISYEESICELSPFQSQYYEDEKDSLIDLLSSGDYTVYDIFSSFARLQTICCGFTTDRNGKLIDLKPYKPSLLRSLPKNEPVVVFCKYIYEVDQVIAELGAKCSEFTGRNIKDRDSELEKFIAGETQFFVATMQSGGTGLNGLQNVCSTVCFYSQSFSFAQRHQSISRINRQGQTKDMTVIDFYTYSGIDKKISVCIDNKKSIVSEIKRLMANKQALKNYCNEL